MRKLIGWLVATEYVLTRRRCAALRRYDESGTVLSFYSHNPKPRVLEGVLRFLAKKGFTFISTDQLLAMKSGKTPWMKRCAWLTFDDGWAGFTEHLLPILERYNCPATIFIAPHETMRGQVWTNAIMPYEKNWRAFYALPTRERDERVDRILAHRESLRALLSEDELKQLAKHPLITLENHTFSHLSCSSRPIFEVVDEVRAAQKILTDWTGRAPRLCCYPFGHWTPATDRAIRELGLAPVHSDPGVMTRTDVGAKRNLFTEDKCARENVGRVLGAWPRVRVPQPPASPVRA